MSSGVSLALTMVMILLSEQCIEKTSLNLNTTISTTFVASDHGGDFVQFEFYKSFVRGYQLSWDFGFPIFSNLLNCYKIRVSLGLCSLFSPSLCGNQLVLLSLSDLTFFKRYLNNKVRYHEFFLKTFFDKIMLTSEIIIQSFT